LQIDSEETVHGVKRRVLSEFGIRDSLPAVIERHFFGCCLLNSEWSFQSDFPDDSVIDVQNSARLVRDSRVQCDMNEYICHFSAFSTINDLIIAIMLFRG
jgi:hypothetical protein